MKMKLITSNFLLFITPILFFSACKKGDGDPFLSLKSRKARLCREWVLTNQNLITRGFQDNSQWIEYTIIYENGTRSVTTTVNQNDKTQTDTKYEFSINFLKDFKYESREKSYWPNGVVKTETVENGTWTFLNKNQSEEFKNKERISTCINSRRIKSYNDQNEILNNEINNFINYVHSETFTIYRLTSKQMIFEIKSRYRNENQPSNSSFEDLTEGTETYKSN